MVKCGVFGTCISLLILFAPVCAFTSSGGPSDPARVWEADSPPSNETAFLEAVRTFLINENVAPQTVQIEIKGLGYLSGPDEKWRALADVSVFEDSQRGFIKHLILDRGYWLAAGRDEQFSNHRLAKVLWHEIHHLDYFPGNLRRAEALAASIPPRSSIDPTDWKRQWIKLQEPLEELAAERTSIERYNATFGPLPEELLADSRQDMLRYAVRYHRLFSSILLQARDPDAVRQRFPQELPIDPEGNIRAQ